MKVLTKAGKLFLNTGKRVRPITVVDGQLKAPAFYPPEVKAVIEQQLVGGNRDK